MNAINFRKTNNFNWKRNASQRLSNKFQNASLFWVNKSWSQKSLSKKYFLAKKKFEFHVQVQKCHFGKNEKLPNGTFEHVHEIQNFFWPKAFFWSIMKMATRKNSHNLSKGPPNPGFMQEKVQKGDFLKKDSRDLKLFCCLGSYESRKGLERWIRSG